jgi:heme A synthase
MAISEVQAAPRRATRGLPQFAWGVLAYNILVILWGAYVRATGSGAGCGNHWPLCNGEVVPQAPGAHTVIEFTHRMMTGIDVVPVGLLVWWVFRAFPRRHPARLGAVLSAVFLMSEALIGAALVKLEHVAKNASVGHAYSLSGHLVNTLTLLACLTLTAWWASGNPRLRIRGRAAWLAGISLLTVVPLGVSGAIAALGDTLFPATSLAASLAQDLDPAANIFLRLRIWHPVIAAGAAVWLLFYAINSGQRRAGLIVIAALTAQLCAGLLNLLLLAPVWMQMLHLLLADVLWISLVLLAASTLSDPIRR